MLQAHFPTAVTLGEITIFDQLGWDGMSKISYAHANDPYL